MRLIAIAFILLLSATTLKADFVFTPACLKAYEAALSFRFGECSNHLTVARKETNNKGIILLTESYRDFLEAALLESPEKQKRFLASYPLRLKQLETLNTSSPWYRYVQAEILLQAAALHFYNQEYLSGGLNANKALRILERNQKQFPDFAPNWKMLGVLHVAIGSFPDEINRAMKLFNVKGSVNLGITELSKLLEQSLRKPELQFMRNEALFLLTWCEMQYRKDEATLTRLLGFFQTPFFMAQVKEMPALTYINSTLLVKLRRNDEAIDMLAKRNFSTTTSPFCFLDYMHGECLLNRLDTSASFYFQRFLRCTPGQSYRKSAWQKLAWNALIQGDSATYFLYMRQTAAQGLQKTESDKNAQLEAESGKPPIIHLLKARLLFDGAYYEEALSVLRTSGNNTIPITLTHQLEYEYRLARIYQELKRYNEAESHYMIVIDKGKSLPQYFAANAALQMGFIYEAKGNRQKAIEYFRLCLSIKPQEYRYGIHQKAKAGLSRLQQ